MSSRQAAYAVRPPPPRRAAYFVSTTSGLCFENMDGSGQGEAGVLAWCNSIRFSIAKDTGREFLDTQIQKQGFDFLDSYLDDVFSRESEGYVFPLNSDTVI